jgi:LPS-assembly lipoprotein
VPPIPLALARPRVGHPPAARQSRFRGGKLECVAAGRRGLLVLSVATLAGCGFKLRQPPKLAFKRIALVGFAPRSPLADDLRRQLGAEVQVLDAPANADVILEALVDERLRSVVASTAAAQVRELQLRLRFHFRARTPAGRELIPRAELLLSRDLSYSETAALAKEQEEADLFRDMQSDVVTQVLRRLSTLVF